MLAEVDPRLRQSLPPGHYAFAVLAAERAMITLALGDVPAALQLMNQAVAIVEAAVRSGKRCFLLPVLLTRRSAIELEAGHPDQAIDDANRALRLQSAAQPGILSSSQVTPIWLWGAPCARRTNPGKLTHAFRLAVENLQSTLGPVIPILAAPGRWPSPKASVDRLTMPFPPSCRLFASVSESQVDPSR